MKWAETRLEGFKEIVGLEVGVELGGDDAFKCFGEEWQVRDGAIVGEVSWVEGGLFEDRGDGGKFVGRRNMAMG